MIRCIRLFVALLVLSPAAARPAAAETADLTPEAAQSGHSARLCDDAVGAAERRLGIPDKLLTAISHAESGRWDGDRQATIAWPWTVTAEGSGHYLPSRAAAIAKVEELRARGVRSIDVGCMQINLYYHADAFDDLDAAFDPQRNADYAAEFLAALHGETRSWPAAASRYHSATPEHAVPYRARVMRLWQAARASGAPPQDVDATAAADDVARRRAADAHRQAVVAAYLARRAEHRAARAEPLYAAARQ
jgi:hypothetical protein